MAAEKVGHSDFGQAMNVVRGTGASSRISLDFDKLRSAGWKITERVVGQRTYYNYASPEGKSVKSAKDIERRLCDENTIHQFLKAEDAADNDKHTMAMDHTDVPNCSKVCDDDVESDVDYEPPEKQKNPDRSHKQ